MSDIRQVIPLLEEPLKSIGTILIEFYETMKELEKDEYKGGKQATKLVMTINDLYSEFTKKLEEQKLRDYDEKVREAMYCVSCLAMFEEECCCEIDRQTEEQTQKNVINFYKTKK